MASPTGESRLGPYRVLGEIGRGGMGVVLRALAPSGEEVAVKLLKSAALANADQRARFERERRLLAGLGKGFVPLLDSGEAPAGPYLVMPYLRGGTLRDRLSRGPFPIEDAVDLGCRLARALGQAHEAGIVHRDLKPENVLFDAAGQALVADLGLAKHADASLARSLSLSIAGEARGTYGYMPPEQMEDSKAANARCDVFSLGAILYECLAGAPAFQGDNLLEVLSRVSSGEVTPLAQQRPEVPPWLAAVVERTLATDPLRRPANGNALALELEAGGKTSSTRAPLGAAVVAGLALVGTGSAAALWLTRSPTSPPTVSLPTPPSPTSPSLAPPSPNATTRAPIATPSPRAPGHWRTCAPMPYARMKLAAATAPDGKIHITGGRGAKGTLSRHDLYDPVADRWTPLAPLPSPRALHGSAFLGSRLYVAGGEADAADTRGELFEWDPATDGWLPRAPLPLARSSLLLLAHEGKLWAIGGRSGSTASRATTVYDPDEDAWSKGPSLPDASAGTVAVSIGERIVVVDEAGVVFWSLGVRGFRAFPFAKPELGLSATAGGLIGGRIVLASGRRADAPVRAVVSFDATSEGPSIVLEEQAPVTQPRRSHAAAVSGGKLYIFGGLVEGERRALDSVEEYTP